MHAPRQAARPEDPVAASVEVDPQPWREHLRPGAATSAASSARSIQPSPSLRAGSGETRRSAGASAVKMSTTSCSVMPSPTAARYSSRSRQTRSRPVDAEFLAQPAAGAGCGGLAPVRMRAAGVRPEAGAVVLVERPALDQHRGAPGHEDRDRLVAQPHPMHRQLLHGRERAVDPGGNELVHVISARTSPVRCAMFLAMIRRCAIGLARTMRLFM